MKELQTTIGKMELYFVQYNDGTFGIAGNRFSFAGLSLKDNVRPYKKLETGFKKLCEAFEIPVDQQALLKVELYETFGISLIK